LQDPQSEAELVAGTAGVSALAKRDTEAVFLEGVFPILDSMAVSLAARHEDFSDVGDDLSSKLTSSYQPSENLRLYASYSENHQAPSLPIMNSFSATSFTNIRDPFIDCFVCNYNILEIRQANSALQSEQTKNFTFNISYQPSSWLDLQLNYWRTKTNSRIRTITAQQVRDAEVNGETLPPGIGCDRLPNGTITQCTTGYINDGFLKTSGIDLHAQLEFNVLNGQLSHELIVSHLLNFYLNDRNNLIGSAGWPENRAILNNQFAWHNWQIAYHINLIGRHDGVIGQSLDAPNWVTHDVQINYHTPWQSTLTLGAQNVGEKYPPIAAGALTDSAYQFDLYDGFGRIVYARYSQTF
jgi:iron complex outermembrane receptor protein